MSVPPLPPKPRENVQYPGPPPPLPPLPPSVRQQEQVYNTPSVYELESPPHFERPLIAPRPHRVDRSIPANMARTLDDQAQINYAPGFQVPASAPPIHSWASYHQPSPNDLAQSIQNLTMAPPIPQSATYPQQQPPLQRHPSHQQPPPQRHPTQPQPPPPPHRQQSLPQSEAAVPSLTAPLPQLAQLTQAAPQIQAQDPALQIAWCRDVFFLVDRAISGPAPPTDPPVGPAAIPDPALARLAAAAVPLVLQLAASMPGATGKLPPPVAEAISIRAQLATSGAFPELVPHNPRTAFRDFEAAARGGFAPAWFRLGRDYENFSDHPHARDCFERGAKLGVEACLYRMGMAHLLGQLSLPASPALALPLLHRAALLASLATPQPAYVYALLLLSEFTSAPPLPTALLAPLIPAGSSPTLEARKHLERAAYLHFPAAQYKLGHAYEFAEPPFAWDPLLSVQYYALASAAGEAEADMALSKWFLCGSGGAALAGTEADLGGHGGFEKDESLALTFAEKAAGKGLPSAEFAMGYYAEVGVGQPRDVAKAVRWYKLAQHASPDAAARLAALSAPAPAALSRSEHERLAETRLVRRRTQAAARADGAPVSPPWAGQSFPTGREVRERQSSYDVAPPNSAPSATNPEPVPGPSAYPARRRPQDPRLVVDVIRKNSLAFASLGAASQGAGGRMPGVGVGGGGGGGGGVNPNAGNASFSPARAESPTPTPTRGGGRGQSPQRLPIGVGAGAGQYQQQGQGYQSPQQQTPPRRASPASLAGSGASLRAHGQAPGQGQGLTRLERMRLNLDEPGAAPGPGPGPASAGGATPTKYALSDTPTKGYALSDTPVSLTTPRPVQGGGGAVPATATPTAGAGAGTSVGQGQGGGKKPQTFAEMGFHGARADEKDCVVM